MIRRIAIVAVATLLLTVSASAQKNRNREPLDLSRYYALGDNYSAGYTNGSLIETHQRFSFPAIVAQQARVPFEQPLIESPGIHPETVLLGLFPLKFGQRSGPVGGNLNRRLDHPYNNLAIPGLRVADLRNVTGFEATNTVFEETVLRGYGNAVDQVASSNPTFVTLWIGTRDLLQPIVRGNINELVPAASFRADYDAIVKKLTAAAPGAEIVVFTLPDVTRFPFVKTIPSVALNPRTGQPLRTAGGSLVPLLIDRGEGVVSPIAPDEHVTLVASRPLEKGAGIPAEFQSQFPEFTFIGSALGRNTIVTDSELALVRQTRNEYNAAIRDIARQYNLKVFDIAPLYDRFAAGLNLGGIRLSDSFPLGGLFGFDGLYPTDIASTLIANEVIRFLNQNYAVRIPVASLQNVMVPGPEDL